MSTETNSATAGFATQSDALSLTRFHLIGIVGAEDNLRALLRQRNGNVETVQIGDETAMGRVIAIDARRVVLANSTGQRLLEMPGQVAENADAA